jgi:hypothetical protein
MPAGTFTGMYTTHLKTGDFGLPGLVGYRPQGWDLALPDDLPALGPKDHLLARGTYGKDLHGKSLAGTKELQGDTKAEGGVATRLKGQLSLSAGEGADAVVKGGLARRSLARNAERNADQYEAAVGRELTCLRPILLYLENAGLPRPGAQARNPSRSPQPPEGWELISRQRLCGPSLPQRLRLC